MSDVGMTRSEAKREEHPPPRCPHCGGRNIEIEPEEKEMGFTMHPAQGVCYDCEKTWRAG